MFKNLFFGALIALCAPSIVTAQINDSHHVAIEAMKYMQKDLGQHMVVDSGRHVSRGVRAAEFRESFKAAGIPMADSETNKTCLSRGYTSFKGPQKYVSFHAPVIAGDSASVKVWWSYNGERSKILLSMTSTLHLSKTGTRWMVVGETRRTHIHSLASYCEFKK
jgi:hypothetical protein